MRRVLLSSLEGAAITGVKIEGVSHEFSTIPGVTEDVLDIILNLKELVIKSFSENAKTIYLDAKKKGEVKAGDIKEDPEINILNKDHHIATIAKDGKLSVEMLVDRGKGFVTSERNKNSEQPIGFIPIDSAFSPVIKVNFSVDPVRVGQFIDFERLNLEVWTNGSITAEEAVSETTKKLKSYFNFFDKQPTSEEEVAVNIGEELLSPSVLNMNIDDLELSARSQNCLKKAGIETVNQLLSLSQEKLIKIKNLGRKSFDEIQEKLIQYKSNTPKTEE
jgi:DNA-directed RNA polymerase subunit alpha